MEKNLKPIGVLIGDAWNLYKKHMNAFALIAAIPFLFWGVKIVFAPYLLGPDGVPSSLAGIAFLGFFSLLYLVFIIVLPLALTIAIGHADKGETPDANAVYKKAFSSFFPYVCIVLLVLIVGFGGSVLFIIPGIIASIYLTFAMYAFIFENKKGVDALVESAWYVKGFWWDILARKITLAIITIVAMILFGAIIGPLVFALGFNPLVFAFLFNLFVFIFVLPFSMTFSYLVYKDAKHAQAARGHHSSVESSFRQSAEKIYIILIVVAAAAALLVYALISFIPAAYTAGFGYGSHM